MGNRTRHRPHRGEEGPNVLVTGDEGIFGGPQGGAEPGATESGDLLSREYGVPQADIPGGLVHMANAETAPAKTPDKARRPADYHKYHGVPSDDGQYHMPPGTEHDRHLKPEPEPKFSEAVPVYIVEQTEGKVRRESACFNINVPAAGGDPARICSRDPARVSVQVLNEDSSTDIRIAEKQGDLVFDPAQGVQAGSGALIWHGTNSYTEIDTQEELFAITTSTSATARLSVIISTERKA